MGDLCLPITTSFSVSNGLDATKAQYFSSIPRTFQHHPPSNLAHDIQIAEQLEISDFKPTSHTQSPFDSLPNELVSLILERGYFDGTHQPDNSFRASMVRTSHRIRQISIHTPSLWSIIKVTPGNTLTQLTHLIPTYLIRSKDYSLSIELTFLTRTMEDFVMGELVPHSKRWKSLSLSITTSGDNIFSFIHHIPVPHLEYLSISCFSSQPRLPLPSPFMTDCIPRLLSLYLRNVGFDYLTFPFRNVKTLDIRACARRLGYPQLTTILENSQSLENLILHIGGDVLREMELMHRGRSQILLPSLRSLVVHTSEWLTERINILIRSFSCPKLQTLVVLESTALHTILSYDVEAGPLQNSISSSSSPSCPRSLVVWSASVYLSCLSVPSSTLTTLELHKVVWPAHSLLKEAFGSLRQLRHLLVFGLNPGDAFVRIMDDLNESHLAELDSSILIPSLLTLTIEFGQTSGEHESTDRTASFLRLFSLPQVASLNLRHITFLRWKNIVNTFARHASEYPALVSLTLSDMTDVIPTPGPSDYRNPAEAFPLLQRLSLDRIHSNAFIQHLLPLQLPNCPSDSTPPPSPLPTLPWPYLCTLSVTGDANVSKPLLRRVITIREWFGVPFDKMCLDYHHTTNVDFWDWVMEKVDVELITNVQANWWFQSP